jgi:hypothetical protein
VIPFAWAAAWLGAAVVVAVIFGRTVKHADEKAGITQEMQDRGEVQR